MRLRALLGAAVLAVAVVFALEMSGRAVRIAGTDHTSPAVFAANVPGGGRLCQQVPFLPSDATRVQFVLGTYGHPVPAIDLSFLDAVGRQAAYAHLPAGAREGTVRASLRWDPGAGEPTNVCMHLGGRFRVVLAGETGPVEAGSEVIQGVPQPGRVSLQYLRGGPESWWQMLPTLAQRFGLGKSPMFGGWTLPVLAALLAGIWVLTVRLLLRELK